MICKFDINNKLMDWIIEPRLLTKLSIFDYNRFAGSVTKNNIYGNVFNYCSSLCFIFVNQNLIFLLFEKYISSEKKCINK